MITYNHDDLEMNLRCDNCDDAETFKGSWNRAIKDARDAGWNIIRTSNADKHYCPFCKAWS